MNLTPEQLAIVEAARDTTDNLLVSALAGAAKTTTLVEIAKALPKVDILCLAFNKRIATEMQDRLPGNCTAKTLNSLGHSAWADTIGRRLKVDAGKNYKILRELIELLDPDERGLAFASFTDILQAIAAGKTCGWVPEVKRYEKAKRLMGDDDFHAWLDVEPTDLEWGLIREASIRSLDLAHQGEVDFDDQILCPTVFTAFFPRYPLVMVDEAQDLSALNHAMLRKIAKKRLIAVGDECQSIYGFRGAHEDSMQLLKCEFNMRELILSVSFRCPQNIVREAQWRAPHMRWPEWADEGEVTSLSSWNVEDIPDDATILCRNNAPLFAMAIKLLRHGRYPQLIGSDIGKSLIKLLKKLGRPDMPQAAVLEAIAAWQAGREKKSRNIGSVRDQAECMRIFARQARNLGDTIAYAESLLKQHGPVQLMTIHKSKGLEFNHVYLLDRELIRVAEHQQERNLLYVGQTRAKQTLTYITSGGFIDAEEH